jgi:hypothetical protein
MKDIKKECQKCSPNCGETKYVQTNTQEQPIAIIYIENNKVWFFLF